MTTIVDFTEKLSDPEFDTSPVVVRLDAVTVVGVGSVVTRARMQVPWPPLNDCCALVPPLWARG